MATSLCPTRAIPTNQHLIMIQKRSITATQIPPPHVLLPLSLPQRCKSHSLLCHNHPVQLSNSKLWLAVSVCVHVRVCVCVRVCMCASVYVHICICVSQGYSFPGHRKIGLATALSPSCLWLHHGTISFKQ